MVCTRLKPTWVCNGYQLPDYSCKSGLVLLVQRGNSLSGLDLIQAEGEGEAAGQLLDAADVRRRPVQVWSLVLQQLVEQLQQHTHTRVDKVLERT